MTLTGLFLLLVYAFTATAVVNATADSTTSSDDGNGFESEGIDGHHGIFRSFDWTQDELRSISLWHATAQYHNVIELVKVGCMALCFIPYVSPQKALRKIIGLFGIQFTLVKLAIFHAGEPLFATGLL
jgi:hypothetical protein